MSWRKNHFVLIAQTIQSTRAITSDDESVGDAEWKTAQHTLDNIAVAFADKFEALAPDFMRDRFLRVAGVAVPVAS